MAIITIKIDERIKAGRVFLDFIKTLPFVSIQEEGKQLNAETEKAIKNIEAGKGLTKTTSHSDLMDKLNA